jgi:pimeloyl-ACP methyl ester carboxylesterase
MTPKYAHLNGIRLWYDEHGEGEPLVMRHPGGADSSAFGPNLQALALRFHVFLSVQRGHGHTPDPDGPYSYQLMADDTIRFLDFMTMDPVRTLAPIRRA